MGAQREEIPDSKRQPGKRPDEGRVLQPAQHPGGRDTHTHQSQVAAAVSHQQLPATPELTEERKSLQPSNIITGSTRNPLSATSWPSTRRATKTRRLAHSSRISLQKVLPRWRSATSFPLEYQFQDPFFLSCIEPAPFRVPPTAVMGLTLPDQSERLWEELTSGWSSLQLSQPRQSCP